MFRGVGQGWEGVCWEYRGGRAGLFLSWEERGCLGSRLVVLKGREKGTGISVVGRVF